MTSQFKRSTKLHFSHLVVVGAPKETMIVHKESERISLLFQLSSVQYTLTFTIKTNSKKKSKTKYKKQNKIQKAKNKNKNKRVKKEKKA